MFEKATKLKLRFKTSQGVLSVEDLWDLSLESLDTLARGLNKSLKELEEESFIKARTVYNSTKELQFNIVKRVIEVKLEEQEKRRLAASRKEKKDRLLSIIAQKQDEELASKSISELQAELSRIDDL